MTSAGLIGDSVDVTNEPHQRINQLERDYHTLASDVNAIARGQSELGAVVRAQGDRLERIGEGVDRLIDERANRGWNTQNVIAALGAIAAVLFGGSQYIELQLNHVEDDIARNSGYIETLAEFRFQAHHEFGRVFERADTLTSRLDHYDEMYHKLDDMVREEQKKSEASRVSRQAIGGYAKEAGSKAE